jgi:transposase
LLAAIPGVGKIAALAIVASAPDPRIFTPGRDFSAWLGSTPRQDSSGGKEKPGAIAKQGNRAIRRLLVLGGAIAASDCGGATSLLLIAGKRKGSPHEIGWSLFSRASPRD